MLKDKYIIESDISYEMKRRYPVYALSVIKDRALPDVRDGLKPVHRRILFAMKELGLIPEKGYRKCARIVGDVLGKYHPHGDTSVYDALVRMAQDFSMRYVLVDGHGNFGSIDGDSPAAMRYTEAKMKKLMLEMLRDIEKDTVNFKPNFDGEEKEPVVLPSRFPNLLVNGSSGIAVGMATNIPPHNLGEIIDGTVMLIDNLDITIDELMNCIQAPDFPTGGYIVNKDTLINMYKTGEGSFIVRGKYHIENLDDKKQIVFTEIPYKVNKAKLCTAIANLYEKKDKILRNILDVRDESDRTGMRLVVEIKNNEDENLIISRLFQKTKLQDSFSTTFRALVNGKPKILNLKDMICHYVDFQKEIITRRSNFDLNKAETRSHILEGLKIALDNLDAIISIIRSSKTSEIAKNTLMEKFNLSEKQSQVILEMKLRRLTGLERDKVEEEYNELIKQINYLKEILSNEEKLNHVLKEDLLEIKDKYSDKRRTEILQKDDVKVIEIKKEDLIEEFTTTLILTEQQYFKKTRKYSLQQKLKDSDEIKTIIQCSNKDKAIFISNQGNAYFLNLWEVNEQLPSKMGQFLPNLLPLEKNESILGMVSTNNYKGYTLIVYEDGHAVKIPLSSYKTKNKRSKLSNCLADINPILITQITNDISIELTDNFGKTKTLNSMDIPIKSSRNSQGKTMWSSKKQDWKLSSAKLITDK